MSGVRLRAMRAIRAMFSGDKASDAKIEGNEGKTVIPISEYRRLLADDESTDQQIRERLAYLENFLRTIIRIELENYVGKT